MTSWMRGTSCCVPPKAGPLNGQRMSRARRCRPTPLLARIAAIDDGGREIVLRAVIGVRARHAGDAEFLAEGP